MTREQMFFEASIVFQTWDGALDAADALRAAGYQVAIIADQVDLYSEATFVEVSRASETDLWEDVQGIVEDFHGDVTEAGLVPNRLAVTDEGKTLQ